MQEKDKSAARPFSLRLTQEERHELERQAGRLPLGAYIREQLFGASAQRRRTRGQFPIKSHQCLAKALAMLGHCQLGNSLRELARAAGSGSLPVTPETEEALRRGASDLATIKRLLMAALGIKEG